MYLIPIYISRYYELLIIDDEDDLKEFMINYINDILDYDSDGYFAPAVISFYNYLYYIPNENELDFDKIKDSELINNYQCINDKDMLKYIDNKYKKIKYNYNVNININIDNNIDDDNADNDDNENDDDTNNDNGNELK